MDKYIKELKKLIEYEREAEVTVMENEIKRTSAMKREKLGRAINNVKGKKITSSLGYTIIQYGRKDPIKTEISVADEVLISRGNPLKSDLTGTVTEIGTRFVKIAIENVPKWALKKNIRLDLYISDITYKRMILNLENLSINGKKALNYVLKDNNLKKYENKENIKWIDKKLNSSQKIAILNSLETKDFFLIHGPFGTGKTRTLIELIKQELKKGSKILTTTESNSAVDNILERLNIPLINCTRLGNPTRVSNDNIKYSLAYKIEKHEKSKEINTLQVKIEKFITERDEYLKPTPRYRRGFKDEQIITMGEKNKGSRGINSKQMNSMSNWLKLNKEIIVLQESIKELLMSIEEDIINESNVILSTNSSASLDLIKNTEFDIVIIDEASQATIPSVLIPIAKAKKFILAGDHKQLPPTILSSKASKLSKTLFEILIEKYFEKSKLLDVQYRMNNQLMKFPNNEFYEGKLKSAKSIDEKDSLIFIDTSKYENNEERRLKDSKSFINKLEASLVIKVVNKLLNMGFNKEDIGIITPYIDQVNLIKNKTTSIEVKSVDGFQGREKEIIIISTVRSNEKGKLGFLTDLRRLNVSITRAKRKLIIIGNSDTLKYNETYAKLINSIPYNKLTC